MSVPPYSIARSSFDAQGTVERTYFSDLGVQILRRREGKEVVTAMHMISNMAPFERHRRAISVTSQTRQRR